MHLLHTVRCPLPGEIMALHRTRISATLCQARDINRLDAVKRLNRQCLADHPVFDRATQLTNKPLRLAPGLLGTLHAGRGKLLRSLAIQT